MPITRYLNNKNRKIKHSRYIDTTKVLYNTRLLSINTYVFKPKDNEKINMIIKSYETRLIDIILMNETNTKQTPWNQDKIKKEMKKLGREIQIETANSGKQNLTKNEWLPGRVVSTIRGKAILLIETDDISKGKYGNQIAMKLKNNGKILLIINIYRIPITSLVKVCSCLTQYNLMYGKAKSPTEYQNEIFKEIKDFIKKNNNVNDIILARDLNQDITSRPVQQFFSKIGIRDIHQHYNQIEFNRIDYTEVRGS